MKGGEGGEGDEEGDEEGEGGGEGVYDVSV